jgi:hypothetical protein
LSLHSCLRYCLEFKGLLVLLSIFVPDIGSKQIK